jgi:hypothetical protein
MTVKRDAFEILYTSYRRADVLPRKYPEKEKPSALDTASSSRAKMVSIR